MISFARCSILQLIFSKFSLTSSTNLATFSVGSFSLPMRCPNLMLLTMLVLILLVTLFISVLFMSITILSGSCNENELNFETDVFFITIASFPFIVCFSIP